MASQYGPLWQLKENAKGKRLQAQQAREEAAKALARADKLDAEASEYDEAAGILEAAKKDAKPI